MKFGKVDNIENVDFTIPKSPESTNKFLASLPSEPAGPEVRFGATGWGNKEWIGSIYPEKTKAKDFLYYYSRQFHTIELNTTHYRIPTEKSVLQWNEVSPSDFKFCPKVLQRISHSKLLGTDSDLITLFCNSIAILQDKIGCCFMQLPPYFGSDRLEILKRFLLEWPSEIPLAIELRHSSWFVDPQVLDNLEKLLIPHKCGLVITDVAGRRDVLHQRITSEHVLLRFVGNGLHPTDFTRWDEWANQLSNWIDSGLNSAYIFIHEPHPADVPNMTDYSIKKLNEHSNLAITTLSDPSDITINGGGGNAQLGLF